MSDSNTDGRDDKPRRRSHGPLRAMFSVMAAFFGVQSSANLEHDDEHGKAIHFILFGLLATAVLVGSIIVFVNVLIAQAG